MTAAAIVGSLLGTALGDAIGLPYEALSRRRAARLLGAPDRHRFAFGYGMVSDDTEHACMVAQALIAAGTDPPAFARSFGWRLRWWLLSLPAGVGFATLRATVKLWCGFPPERSGVFSAGNGPAMRAAVLGAAIDDPQLLRRMVRASTRVTHADPRAEHGALAVALAARFARRQAHVEPADYLAELRADLALDSATELLQAIERAVRSVNAGESTLVFAAAQGLDQGVSGYVCHTVPAAIHAWLRHPRDFAACIGEIVRCGGDTDTTAAIAGGIVGCAVGRDGLPDAWLKGLAEWPRTVPWIEQLGQRLAQAIEQGKAGTAPRLPLAGVLLRNLVFLGIVLCHVGRRCLPPY